MNLCSWQDARIQLLAANPKLSWANLWQLSNRARAVTRFPWGKWGDGKMDTKSLRQCRAKPVARTWFEFWLLIACCPSIFTHPLTAEVVGAPQTTSQPISSIFLSSSLPSATWQTQGLSIACCWFPTSFCLPCLLPPFTVPCKMVLDRSNERETCPYYFSLHRQRERERVPSVCNQYSCSSRRKYQDQVAVTKQNRSDPDWENKIRLIQNVTNKIGRSNLKPRLRFQILHNRRHCHRKGFDTAYRPRDVLSVFIHMKLEQLIGNPSSATNTESAETSTGSILKTALSLLLYRENG